MGLNLGRKECPKCGYKEDSDNMHDPPAYCPKCDTPMNESYLRAGVVFTRKGIKKIVK